MKKVLLFLVAITMVQFTVFADAPESVAMATDDCASATDLSSLLGGTIDMPMSSPMYDNTGATATAQDSMLMGFECFGEPDGGGATPSLENTQWVTFTGDGGLYSILTTDCGGTVTDYIDFGDTQIAIYSGADCDNLIPVACNEDVAGVDPNGPYPAGLDFQTESGVVYYMMIDGFNGSDGEYCIEFTQRNPLNCDDIAIGAASTDLENVCEGETTSFNLADGTLILEGGTFGFRWVVSSDDISGSANPFTEATYLGAFGQVTDPADIYTPQLVNDGTQLAAGTYYFTPVSYAGGNGTVPNIDFDNGCVATGTSVLTNLLPEFDALSATGEAVNEMTPPGSNGEASVMVAGGSGAYTYAWSNGGTTNPITGLIADTYTVTISDQTGCVDSSVVDVVVDNIVGIDELGFEQSIRLFPNPANELTSVQYDFSEMVDLDITVSNTVGQVMMQRMVDGTQSGSVEIDLSKFTNGVYLIKLSDGENQTTRRLVVRK